MPLPKPLFLRATAITIGTVIAVLPLLIVRILLVVGAESLQLDAGIWTKLFYLPYELLFPFALSSATLNREPLITSISLTLKVLLTSVASSPFMIAVFTLLVSLDASGNQGFGATLATILGLAPFLGVLGLAGLLFICFPLIVVGGLVACGFDYLVCRRYRRALDTVSFEQKFDAQSLSLGQRVSLGWKRFKARFQRRQSIQHYTDVILKEEFERYREPVFNRLAGVAEQLSELEKRFGHSHRTQSWESILRQLREQLLVVEQKTLRFHELMKEHLHVEELTFYRYSASVKNVYYGVMDHLSKAAKSLELDISTNNSLASSPSQRVQIDANARAIESIDELVEAVQSLPPLQDYNGAPLKQSISELEDMLARIGEYRV